MNDEENKRDSIAGILRKRILTGLFLLIPVSVTIWIVVYALRLLTGWSVYAIQLFPSLSEFQDRIWFGLLARAISIFVLLALLFCIGQFAKYAFGMRMIAILENLMFQLPMLKSIYLTIKQILDAVRSTKSGMFRQVVLIEYPRKGLYSLAFLTNYNRNSVELRQKTGKELVSVFLPTTPNPTSGFLLLIPAEDCIFLDMNVGDGMRLVISGGVISPEEKPAA